MPTSCHRPPNPLRFCLAAVAALFLLGGGQQALHMATHRHVICQEHGETMDIANAETRVDRSQIDIEQVDADSSDTSQHNHCTVLGTLLQFSLRTSLQTQLKTSDQGFVFLQVDSSTNQVSAASVALAPKTSPPV